MRLLFIYFILAFSLVTSFNARAHASDATTTGSPTATATSSTSIDVSMPYTGDANSNNSYTIDYKLSTAVGWTNWVTGAASTASPFTTLIRGLTPEKSYDVRMTWHDPDGVSGTNPQVVGGIDTPLAYDTVFTTGDSGVDEEAKSVAIDSNGNVFVMGTYDATVDFDPTDGVDNHTAGTSWDRGTFLTKMNSDGSYGWTLTWNGDYGVMGHSIALDSSGNVFITGEFYETIDFDPTDGIDYRTAVTSRNFFLTKVNRDGTYGWTHAHEGHGRFIGYGLAVDSSDNLYVTGIFNGTVDLDPTAGIDIHSPFGNYDIFLTKFAPDGSYLWARTLGGRYVDHATAVAVDTEGNAYISGYFDSPVDFDPTDGTDIHSSKGTFDAFLLKINSDGTYGWVRIIGDRGMQKGYDVDVDSAGNAYITGYFRGTVDFDSTAGTDNHTSNGEADIFITKVSSDGSYLWTRTMGGPDFDVGYSCAVDSMGDVYITGGFDDTTDFDPSVGVDTFTGYYDMFLTKIKSDGSYGWTYTASGSFMSDTGYGVAAHGDAYVAGSFRSTLDFDPSTESDTRTSLSGKSMFLAKFVSDRTSAGVGSVVASGITTLEVTMPYGGDGNGNSVHTVDYKLSSAGSWINWVTSAPSIASPFTTTIMGLSDGASYDVRMTWVDSDGVGGENPQVVTSVSMPSSPVALDGTLTVNEGSSASGTLSATDVDGDVLTYSIVSSGSKGVAAIIDAAVGSYSYTPNDGETGTDTFTFKASDGTDDSNTATVTVTIVPDVNSAPVSEDGTLTVNENTSASGTLVATDADGDSLTYSVYTNGTLGTVVVTDAATGAYAYTPNTGASGTDSFTFKASDGFESSASATVVVTIVNTINDPPSPEAQPIKTYTDLPGSTQIRHLDPDGNDTHTFVITTAPVNGTAVVSATGHVTYTPDAGYTGSDSVIVTVTDNSGAFADVTIPVTVSVIGSGINPFDIARDDLGDGADNEDETTGTARVDFTYDFQIVFMDPSGNAPLSVLLYVTDKSTPAAGDFSSYDLTCTGDYATGALCDYDTKFGPAAARSYYFLATLHDSSLVRYPASGYLTGPSVELINGYGIVGTPRDVSGATLGGMAGFGCSTVYRWVSSGLSAGDGSYVAVGPANPITPGEGYFVDSGSCASTTVSELGAYSNVAAASYSVPLLAGWNLISNPYGENVLLSNVEVQRGSDAFVTWTEAATAGYVTNAVYYYKGTEWGKTYFMETAGGSPDATLVPWLGYWIYVAKDDATYKLIISKP